MNQVASTHKCTYNTYIYNTCIYILHLNHIMKVGSLLKRNNLIYKCIPIFKMLVRNKFYCVNIILLILQQAILSCFQ